MSVKLEKKRVAIWALSIVVVLLASALITGPRLGIQSGAADGAADWVAAIGAWVIGIGATWYAHEAMSARRAQQLNEKEGRLGVLMSAANQLSILHLQPRRLAEERGDGPKVDLLLALMDYVERVLDSASPQVTSSMVHFPHLSGLIGQVQIASMNIHYVFRMVREDLERDGERLGLEAKALQVILTQTQAIHGPADALMREAAAMGGDLIQRVVGRWADDSK
ncbi:hypothetical protein [Stenotrophomonas maltophilia]|uniref:hypothetical protein n=1 Tax=Stenotrophomonas maltophilia TaxID=40324 RepID=UPI0005B6B405|nr:hypothetical protein [Stenotrophomonas maltophilia]KIS40846.1 hypothetical protein WJ66_02942 [Stenotrophomonas maltophilia WJ66]MCF3458547.1 hypothetical protein [Stenotrophomonas maltophilia]MCF3515242.1 hypothetical protein [Stenotrophomonas maltophilia]